jgi:hypothetical protein
MHQSTPSTAPSERATPSLIRPVLDLQPRHLAEVFDVACEQRCTPRQGNDCDIANPRFQADRVAVRSLSHYLQSKAEEVGFEPTVGLHLHRFSRPALSTTQAPLRRSNDRNTLIRHPGVLPAATAHTLRNGLRSWKNSLSTRPHSAASTPAVISHWWFKRGSETT